VVKVIKLQIWVLGELVLDNSLVNLLAIVLLSESLLDVPVSLFLRLSQIVGWIILKCASMTSLISLILLKSRPLYSVTSSSMILLM